APALREAGRVVRRAAELAASGEEVTPELAVAVRTPERSRRRHGDARDRARLVVRIGAALGARSLRFEHAAQPSALSFGATFTATGSPPAWRRRRRLLRS